MSVKSIEYVIIGNSAAGISAVNSLSRLDSNGSVLCISNEKERPYNKCFLADYLSKMKNEEQVFTKIMHSNAEFIFEKAIIEIKPFEKLITMSDNTTVRYGSLLIATGSSPVIPHVEGIEGPGVFTFHTLSDVHNIMNYISECSGRDFSRVTIMGAGLSGLEAADALRSQNHSVTIVDRADRVLPTMIERDASRYIEEKMKSVGIRFIPHQTIVKISRNTRNDIESVVLHNGSSIPTDLLICATGLRPNGMLANKAGLKMIDNSIWVDQNMRTSNEHIYAAGDVVVVRNQIAGGLVRSCTWPDAMHQGMIAAHNMAHRPKEYPGIVSISTSSFFGVSFAAGGMNPSTHKGGSLTPISCASELQEYCRVYLKEGKTAGFCLIGSKTTQLASLRRALMLQLPYASPAYCQTSL